MAIQKILRNGLHIGTQENQSAGGVSLTAGWARRIESVPPLVWLSLLVLACLLPFINKAFFTDDTLFLRAAEQIQKHPVDFYGFQINWFGYSTSMSEAFENPPLTCYYIAAVASVVGWSESALHLAFLLPALAAAWGIFVLAKRHCERPLLASVLGVLTPAFLICATAVMCDVMLLALWVWCLVWFEEGLDTGCRRAFVFSGMLAGLAFLTKFPGFSLVPLVTAYGLLRRRSLGWWVVAPLIPVLFLLGYEGATFALYGHGHLFASAGYAKSFRADYNDRLWEKATIGLAFLGGCFLPALFYSPLVWSRRLILGGVCCLAACLLFVPRVAAWTLLLWKSDGGLRLPMFLFIAGLVVAGASVFWLAGAEAWQRRDPTSILLLLWIGGVFVFTIAINWTINGRSLLPAAPALGILLARRLSAAIPAAPRAVPWRLVWPGLAAGAVGLLLTRADANLANTERTAAREIYAAYHSPTNTIWFRGHSGYQYYLENLGARALERNAPPLAVGDIIILPYRGTDLPVGPADQFRFLEMKEYVSNQICGTLSPADGAGFHASVVGPLPFALGRIRPSYFSMFEVSSAKANAQAKPPLGNLAIRTR